jgi:hypothetical protein
MKRIDESSLSRIWQHIESNNSFGVVSAFRKEFSLEFNLENHEKLRAEIKKNNLGFIEQNSGYSYTDADTNEVVNSEEKSFFIPQCPKNLILTLGRKFRQESILYKDETGFYLIYTDSRFGKVGMTFTKGGKNLTLDKETIKYAYSELIRANKNSKKVKFAFIAEKYVPSMTEGYLAQKTGEIPSTRWIYIL